MRTDVNVLTGTSTLQQWGRPRWFSRRCKLANVLNPKKIEVRFFYYHAWYARSTLDGADFLPAQAEVSADPS
jgi:hypothetical protein